jgi:hypothetical protein
MRKIVLLAAAAALLAGCSAANAEPEPSETASQSTESVTVVAFPSEEFSIAPSVEQDRTLLHEGTMEPVDCLTPPVEFLDWVQGRSGGVAEIMAPDSVVKIGAVVTTATGEWAVLGVSENNFDGEPGVGVFITPNPPVELGELIKVVRQGVAGEKDHQKGELVFGFEVYTSWRGDLLALGEKAAYAALACVS